jgi:hypothetical protein
MSLAASGLNAVLTYGQGRGPSLRFHHLHYRVGDPAAALSRAAAAIQGERVLLRGLGVGVRAGDEYALFDRRDGTEPAGASEASPDSVYANAVGWLGARGFQVSESGRTRAQIADAFRAEYLDHVGFAAADLPAAAAALRAAGETPFRQTGESACFRATGGVIEIVRETGVPDAFWCPMHPDVRSGSAGRCPMCGMALVPMPPLRVGEYTMDVSVTPGARGAGVAKLRLALREPGSREPVTSLATVHERPLHLFIVDRTLEYFAHLHPEPAGDGVFEASPALPPGEYVLIADFLPHGGTSQTVQRVIVTPGYRGPLFRGAPRTSVDLGTEKTVDGVRIRLAADRLKAGRDSLLVVTLADASNGAPITDLEPFLGAPGHMLIVSADLTEASHVHPEEQASGGPSISFHPLMPAAGFYKVWVQFQRHGRVITVPFVFAVQEP